MAKKKQQPQKKEPHDPDSWLRKLHTPDDIKAWMQTERDFISDYMVVKCMAAVDGPKAMADQVKRMGELLELIPDDLVRSCYYDDVGKGWGAFKKNYKLRKRESEATLPKLEKLQKENKAAFFDFGFWEEDGAYHTLDRGKAIRICNFTINILYFVRSENQPKYVCIFRNIFGLTRVSSVTTDDFVGVGTFRKVVGRLGFVFEGNDTHLNKIKLKLFHGVKIAEEPKYMGYNQSGDFYTWANGLSYKGEFYPTDKYGMVMLKHNIKNIEAFMALPAESQVMFAEDLHVLENPERFIEKNGEDIVLQYINQGKASQLSWYFLPFSSKLKVSDHDDDDYEFERRFKHVPPKKDESALEFKEWASLMQRVYASNGRVAIAYYCMSLFRDIVFKANKNYVPLLGFFGPRQSGKSTCARSLNKMFGEGLEDGVNLESGSTATGVRRYLSSMQNAILWLNEYKNSLPDSTRGMIKGIADGSGKLTGRNTGGNETKNYRPRSVPVMCGQDLPTKDPALLSRVIPCEFDGQRHDYKAYKSLTQLEKENRTTQVTCELLKHRDRVKKSYEILEPLMSRRVRQYAEKAMGKTLDDRTLLNISSVLTTFLIVAAPQIDVDGDINEQFEALCSAPQSTYAVDFGYSLLQLENDLMDRVKTQIDIQNTSDDVEQYFNVLQSLIEGARVREGSHYKITKGNDGVKRLYLRVAPIHIEYMSAAQRAGMAAMDQGTLRSYLVKHSSYMEYKKDGVQFKDVPNRTSAHVFDYDKLLAQGIEFRVSTEFESMLPNE